MPDNGDKIPKGGTRVLGLLLLGSLARITRKVLYSCCGPLHCEYLSGSPFFTLLDNITSAVKFGSASVSYRWRVSRIFIFYFSFYFSSSAGKRHGG